MKSLVLALALVSAPAVAQPYPCEIFLGALADWCAFSETERIARQRERQQKAETPGAWFISRVTSNVPGLVECRYTTGKFVLVHETSECPVFLGYQ